MRRRWVGLAAATALVTIAAGAVVVSTPPNGQIDASGGSAVPPNASASSVPLDDGRNIGTGPEGAPKGDGRSDDRDPSAYGVPDRGGAGGSGRAAETSSITTDLRIDWTEPTTVDLVQVSGLAGDVRSLSVAFDDGSTVALPAPAGDRVVQSFSQRTVTAATLTITSVSTLATTPAWSVGKASATQPGTAGLMVYPFASSNGGGVAALSLVDGDPATGSPGSEWAPNPSDPLPRVGLFFDGARDISSVQILGPSAVATDPAYTAAASLYGTLVFDDGSRIPVSGIEGGDSQPTTIGFPSKRTKSVMLDLAPTITQAKAGLREFLAFPTGTTPPRWKTAGTGYAVSPASAGCAIDSAAVGRSTGGALGLVCPAVGASVSGTTTVVVEGVAGRIVDASAYDVVSRTVKTVATATINGYGRAELRVDTSALSTGPTGLRVAYRTRPSGDAGVPLTVQLFNRGGATPVVPTTAPAGKTLVWNEDFSTPLSVTQSGLGADYAATKPAYWGGSEFGEAILADPALGANTLASLDGGYLRIRAQPKGALTDPYGWGRQHVSGLLSSAKVGATGFAAQYGYFEARMLGPSGTGTWPAFWLQDTESATKRGVADFDEIDAVELYGHDPLASCHSTRRWLESGDDPGVAKCLFPNGFSDWSMSWHTYGVQVKPGGADYYIDGVKVASADGPGNTVRPFFFMANLSLGGGYPIRLDSTGNTVDLYVDWVRVYV